MWGLLALFGLLSRFRMAYLIGLVIILGSLLLEHWLARRAQFEMDQHRVLPAQTRSFSVVFLIVTAAEVVFEGGFRLVK